MYLPPVRVDTRYLLMDTDPILDLIIDPSYFKVMNGRAYGRAMYPSVDYREHYLIDKEGIQKDFDPNFNRHIQYIPTTHYFYARTIQWSTEAMPYADAKTIATYTYRCHYYWLTFVREHVENTIAYLDEKITEISNYITNNLGDYNAALSMYSQIRDYLIGQLPLIDQDVEDTLENLDVLASLSGTGTRSPQTFITELPNNTPFISTPSSYISNRLTVTVSYGAQRRWKFNPFGVRSTNIGSNTFSLFGNTNLLLKNNYALTRPQLISERDFSSPGIAYKDRLSSEGLLISSQYVSYSGFLDPYYYSPKFHTIAEMDRGKGLPYPPFYSEALYTNSQNRHLANTVEGLLNAPSGNKTKKGLVLDAWRNVEDRLDLVLIFEGHGDNLVLCGTDEESNVLKKTREYDLIHRRYGMTVDGYSRPGGVGTYGVTGRSSVRPAFIYPGEELQHVEDTETRTIPFSDYGPYVQKRLDSNSVITTRHTELENTRQGPSALQPQINGNRYVGASEFAYFTKDYTVVDATNGYGVIHDSGGVHSILDTYERNFADNHLNIAQYNSRGLGAKTDTHYRRGWNVTPSNGLEWNWSGATHETVEDIPLGPVQGLPDNRYQTGAGYLVNSLDITIANVHAYSGNLWFGMNRLPELPSWIFHATVQRNTTFVTRVEFIPSGSFSNSLVIRNDTYDAWFILTGDLHSARHSEGVQYPLDANWNVSLYTQYLTKRFYSERTTSLDTVVLQDSLEDFGPPITISQVLTELGNVWPGNSIIDIIPVVYYKAAFQVTYTSTMSSLICKVAPYDENQPSDPSWYYIGEPFPELELYVVNFILDSPIT